MVTASPVIGEIEERNRAFEASFNTGDLRALAAAYTEDATVLPPDGEPVHGRAAIEQFWQAVRASGVKSVALRTQSVESGGDLAAEIGTADLTVSIEGTPAEVPVKYVVVWRRQPGRLWELAIDIWNGGPVSE